MGLYERGNVAEAKASGRGLGEFFSHRIVPSYRQPLQ